MPVTLGDIGLTFEDEEEDEFDEVDLDLKALGINIDDDDDFDTDDEFDTDVLFAAGKGDKIEDTGELAKLDGVNPTNADGNHKA